MSELPQPDKRYRSDIPSRSIEQVISRHPDGSLDITEYFVKGKLVGRRQWDPERFLQFERPIRNGEVHGTEYRWDWKDWLLSAEPFCKGKVHGTARQWDQSGKLIGSYSMHHGTGIDLWFDHWPSGRIVLVEATYCVNGSMHGYEWRINDSQQTVWREFHYRNGRYHGINREWNTRGRLSHGFPQYFIDCEKMTKRQYLRACKSDPTLPPFREQDNKPQRTFPPEIAMHLNPRKRKRR